MKRRRDPEECEACRNCVHWNRSPVSWSELTGRCERNNFTTVDSYACGDFTRKEQKNEPDRGDRMAQR